jgi:lipopolysaccharide biosynthesis regulator YciM
MNNQYLFRIAQLNLSQAANDLKTLRFTANENPAIYDPKVLNRQVHRVTLTVGAVASHLIEVDRAIKEINSVVEQKAEEFEPSLLSIIIDGYRSLRNQYNAIFDELQALILGFEQRLI